MSSCVTRPGAVALADGDAPQISGHAQRVQFHNRLESLLKKRTSSPQVSSPPSLDAREVADHEEQVDQPECEPGRRDGVSAGIDLMLAIVEQHHGHAVAMSVAKGLVLFLRRSGRQAQFSSVLKHQERDAGPLGDLSAYVLENLDQPLGLERLARAMSLTPRTLTRRCKLEFDEAPASHVRRIRLEEAQRLLEQTTLPLKTIARRTGLGNTSTVWRVFRRKFGITPAEYRARFSLASAGHR